MRVFLGEGERAPVCGWDVGGGSLPLRGGPSVRVGAKGL